LVRDHGQSGVWWKFNTVEFVRPCVLRHASQCGACGCGGTDQPACYAF
jgi:hypothetical protein